MSFTPDPNAGGLVGARVFALVPAYKDIPDDFKLSGHWRNLADKWFFEGIKAEELGAPREGIDAAAASRHLTCVLRSWDLTHEHKLASAAYLMSQWFTGGRP